MLDEWEAVLSFSNFENGLNSYTLPHNKPTMDKTWFYRNAIRDESTNFPFVYIFMMANH